MLAGPARPDNKPNSCELQVQGHRRNDCRDSGLRKRDCTRCWRVPLLAFVQITKLSRYGTKHGTNASTYLGFDIKVLRSQTTLETLEKQRFGKCCGDQYQTSMSEFTVQKNHTNDRDSLLATILDAVRSSGNQDGHVRIANTPRGKRVVPLSHSVCEETEANLLRRVMHNYQYPTRRFEILERFNANIPHSGLKYSVTQDSLFAENKVRLIWGS